ncbi:uncharacterized protein LOC122927966 [Bufo gargarizans]|uniref:uncharacterized protein LOC122927966 n=1 Tax=Bufo gargarizans TaxID=30331 RepID=UPI001CF5D089|nr:uncharacterized protein LOC122927966 [Bufo gargarizans]
MELSSLDSNQWPPKSDNNVMDTPRTSNLKFLRAKRLNYFGGKSSQNPLSKTEESQNVGQTMKTATPRRCRSAPTSDHVTADNNVPKKINAVATTMSPNREKSLDATEEAKPPTSTSPQDKHANLGKGHLMDSPAPRTLHLPTTEMEIKEHTKHHNLQSVAEISCEPNKSITNSSQLKISNPPVPSIQHFMQPVTKQKAKDMLTQHGPEAALEKSGGKVLFADNVLQSSDKEPESEGYPTYYDPLDTPKQVKEGRYLSTKPEPDEVDVLSTHRSLLSSRLVTDLDQDYLEDLSVPEREKLQHVMTWAKKFLDKCSGGEVISHNGDTLSKNMDEDISFECTGSSRVTDKYLKLNSVGFNEHGFKKHPCIVDEPKESAQGQLLLSKSPRSLYKPKSKSKTAQLDSYLAESMPNFHHSDHEEVDNFSASSCSVFPKLVKNRDVKSAFNIKGYDSLGEQFFDSNKQGHMDSDNLFRNRTKPNRSHYNTHTLKDTKPGPALKDSYIDREDDLSSPDSCLDTERLNSLLEDLEGIEKDLKKTGENDGSRTDRTYLVKNIAQPGANTYISVSGKIPDSLQPALPRVDSSSSLSEGYTRKIYHVCPACGFTNTTSSNWCTECGSALKCAKKQPMVNNRSFELPKPHILDDRAADEIFSRNTQRKSFDNNAMTKQNATELGRAVCWEDNSDVASDSEGSVLEKYFFYVKRLDMLRSQEKGTPTKLFQDQHNSETSSDDESSEDYSIPRVRSGPAKPWGETETLGTDPYHLGDQAMKEDSLKGFNEHINGIEGSNLKGLLDRKLQKAPDISSKVTGPKRYWEKSSIAWSSYTHGELKPRSRHSIQRPTSADFKKNMDQTQADNDTEINAANKTESFIQRENNCMGNANEYKNVAVAYMKTSNAWAVSEHLCKNKWERSTQNHQRR